MKTFDMDLKFGYFLAQKREVEKAAQEEKTASILQAYLGNKQTNFTREENLEKDGLEVPWVQVTSECEVHRQG